MRISDWSSDVCSSDLLGCAEDRRREEPGRGHGRERAEGRGLVASGQAGQRDQGKGGAGGAGGAEVRDRRGAAGGAVSRVGGRADGAHLCRLSGGGQPRPSDAMVWVMSELFEKARAEPRVRVL